MTDKVQRIKEWISKTQDGLMDANGNFGYLEHEGAYHILCNLDAYIDSLQEEPVSEDLEEAAQEYTEKGSKCQEELDAFKAGAKWQKEQMMAKAVDGVVTFDYYEGDKAYGCVAHDSFCLEDLGLKDRDEVKILILKK